MKGHKIQFIELNGGPGMNPTSIWYNSKGISEYGGIGILNVTDIKQPFNHIHAYDVHFDNGSVVRFTNQVIKVGFQKDGVHPLGKML